MQPADFFDHGLRLYPERTAILMPGENGTPAISRSYRELASRFNHLANALLAMNVSEHARIGVIGPYTPEIIEVNLAIWRAGKVWLPLNARSSIEEFEYVINHSEAEVLFFHSSFAKVVETLRPRCPKLIHLVCYGAIPTSDDIIPYEQLLVTHSEEPPMVLRDGNDLMAIPYTGGTTGTPKGVMLTIRNWQSVVITLLHYLDLKEDEIAMHVTPLSHGAVGNTLPIFYVGGTNVVLPRPDPATILKTIEEYKVTMTFASPTLLYHLIDHPSVAHYNYSSLRHMIYGAAPVNTTRLREATKVFGPVLEQLYGQTEAPICLTFLSKQDHLDAFRTNQLERLNSCGRETFLCRVRTMSDDGTFCKPGEMGEVVVRSELVMKGYWQDSEQTASVSQYGWHHTGDIGYLDNEGYLYLIDRKKDMIITGGFNVYSIEVEEALARHPAVANSAVIGVPDKQWGEAVKGIVQLKPGSSVSPEELIAHVKALLGSVKAPKSIDIWEELPLSPVGKVLKKDIRAHYWSGQERMIHG